MYILRRIIEQVKTYTIGLTKKKPYRIPKTTIVRFDHLFSLFLNVDGYKGELYGNCKRLETPIKGDLFVIYKDHINQLFLVTKVIKHKTPDKRWIAKIVWVPSKHCPICKVVFRAEAHRDICPTCKIEVI